MEVGITMDFPTMMVIGRNGGLIGNTPPDPIRLPPRFLQGPRKRKLL